MTDTVYVIDKVTQQKGWVSSSFLTHPDYEDRFEERDPECVGCAEVPAEGATDAVVDARPAGNASREEWAEFIANAYPEAEITDETKRDELIAIDNEQRAAAKAASAPSTEDDD